MEFEAQNAGALRDAAKRIEALHVELLDTYEVFQGTMAIPGMLIGHGLGVLVANRMSNDQIVAHVLAIVAGIRKQLDAESS